jgi:hypothetical protein
MKYLALNLLNLDSGHQLAQQLFDHQLLKMLFLFPGQLQIFSAVLNQQFPDKIQLTLLNL